MARLIKLAVLLLVAAIAANSAYAPAQAQAQAQVQAPEPTRLDVKLSDVIPADDWYGIYIKGSKVGWMHIETAIVKAAPRKRVRNRLEMEMKSVSLGAQGTMRTITTIEFDSVAPFKLVAARHESIDDKIRHTVAISPGKRGYVADVSSGASKQRREVGEIDYTLADWVGPDVWLRRGPTKGASLTVRSLDVEKIDVNRVTSTLLSSTMTKARGVDVLIHELAGLDHKTGIRVQSRHEKNARLLFMKVEELFEARLESEADAKNTTFAVDFFALGSVKLDRELGPVERLRSVTLKASGAGLGDWLKSASNQRIEPSGNGLTIKLGRRVGPPIKATDEELARARKETVDHPIREPRVVALARQAVGDVRTDREKLGRIVQFVNRYIYPTLESTAQPRLMDLLDRKRGDCKSFALMVVALAKASGLPAREVSGLLYMGDQNRSFGGHAWAEVAVDGEWVGVDASIPSLELGTHHIRYGADEQGMTAILRLISAGDFRLQVAEIEEMK